LSSSNGGMGEAKKREREREKRQGERECELNNVIYVYKLATVNNKL